MPSLPSEFLPKDIVKTHNKLNLLNFNYLGVSFLLVLRCFLKQKTNHSHSIYQVVLCTTCALYSLSPIPSLNSKWDGTKAK